MSRRVQKLAGAGLFIQSFPFLFHEFFRLNDFLNGFMRGLGIALILGALFIQRKNVKSICESDDQKAL